MKEGKVRFGKPEGLQCEARKAARVNMKAIKIRITSFISDDQPGLVECKLNDVYNKEHIIREKVPVVTLIDLDANSKYPQDGVIACEIIKQWVDKGERTILTVTTVKPWAVETIEGLSEFDIFEEQLIEINQ
jgi:hypothetical protein